VCVCGGGGGRAADEEGHWHISVRLLAAVKTARYNVAAGAVIMMVYTEQAGRQIDGQRKAAALAAPLCGLQLSLRNDGASASLLPQSPPCPCNLAPAAHESSRTLCRRDHHNRSRAAQLSRQAGRSSNTLKAGRPC
jgi:hypothetical protein